MEPFLSLSDASVVTLDALLAIAHHLAVFSLVSLLVVELVLVRAPMTAAEVTRFVRIDGLYGLSAVAVLVAGVARVAWGAIPADYYLGNVLFWVKMGALVAMTILSLIPTVRGLRWRKSVVSDASWAVPESEVRVVRRFVRIEVAILPVVPIAAALMARGFGAL